MMNVGHSYFGFSDQKVSNPAIHAFEKPPAPKKFKIAN
jgi:hypothetical protein